MTVISTRTTQAIGKQRNHASRTIQAAACFSLTFLAVSGPLAAQAKSSAYAPTPTPRVELFGGYSYLYPNATASGLLPGGVLPVSSCLCAITKGAGVSATFPITRWIGTTVDASGHWGGQSGSPAQRAGNADAYNISAGPQFVWRGHRFSPFAEALFGADRLAPSEFHQHTAFGLIAGGGVDIAMGRHIALRPVQADFVYSNHRFGPSPTVATTDLRGLRLQAGVVFSFGGKTHANAPVAMVPAPVAPAHVAPAIVAPAPVVAAPVDVVTLAATAVPAQINAGESSTIAANAVSTLGRPLTFSYASNEGNIAGNGSTALLTTAGLGAGTALVTVHVANDLGQQATQTVSVALLANVVPALTLNVLGEIGFTRDIRRPARVDNEAKALLDQVALSLRRSSDATIALVGYASSGEKNDPGLAALRARNAKAYLVDDEGIDAARITLYTGHDNARKVEVTMVPAGVTFPTGNLVKVEEKSRYHRNRR